VRIIAAVISIYYLFCILSILVRYLHIQKPRRKKSKPKIYKRKFFTNSDTKYYISHTPFMLFAGVIAYICHQNIINFHCWNINRPILPLKLMIMLRKNYHTQPGISSIAAICSSLIVPLILSLR
jgi:hypothetical protein